MAPLNKLQSSVHLGGCHPGDPGLHCLTVKREGGDGGDPVLMLKSRNRYTRRSARARLTRGDHSALDHCGFNPGDPSTQTLSGSGSGSVVVGGSGGRGVWFIDPEGSPVKLCALRSQWETLWRVLLEEGPWGDHDRVLRIYSPREEPGPGAETPPVIVRRDVSWEEARLESGKSTPGGKGPDPRPSPEELAAEAGPPEDDPRAPGGGKAPSAGPSERPRRRSLRLNPLECWSKASKDGKWDLV